MFLKIIPLLAILFCAYSFSSVQEIIDQAESCFDGTTMMIITNCINGMIKL